MKVLLISGNRESSPEPPYPLGCAYLSAALSEQGHEVHPLDLLFEEDPVESLESTIEKVGPDLVGLSMRNLDLLTFPEMRSEVPSYAKYVAAIRGHTAAPIVVGGSGFSLAPEACLSAIGADIGIAGEGEVALPALLTKIRLSGGKLPDELRGQVLRTPPGVDLGRISPDLDSFHMRRYYEEGSGGSIQTRRGCNLGCSYCSYPLLEGTRVRTRPPEDVASEMATLRDRYGIDHVTLVDSVFNSPERHALAVAEVVGRLVPQVKWTGFFHPVFNDPGFFKAIKEAGCEGLDMGVDSLSEEVLQRMRKGFTSRDVIAFSDGCHTAGLKFNLSMLFGAPGETPETLQETIDCIRRCDPDSVTCGIGVRLYPGARVSQELIQEGAVKPEEVGLETLYYISEETKDILIDRLREMADTDRRWIIPGLGKNYNPRFFRRLRKHGRRGPIWHLVGG